MADPTLSDRLALAVCRSTGNPDGSCFAICRDCRRDSAAVAHEIANWLRERHGGSSTTADLLDGVGCHHPARPARWQPIDPDKEAMALIPGHDQQRLAALDADGRPFAPDRLRVALAPKLAVLQALGLPQLLGRFAAGETIAATDPDLIALHGHAIAYKKDLAAATLPSPAAKPTGTLRALLAAVGWKLQKVGRIKARGGGRDTYTYRADRVTLPAGVDGLALAAAWLEALRRPALPPGFVFEECELRIEPC